MKKSDKNTAAERKKLKFGAQVVSPLAKYDLNGNLFCVICKNFVKSSALWKVHINSKVHKLNLTQARKANRILEEPLQKRGLQIEKSQIISNTEKQVQKSKDAQCVSKKLNRDNNFSVLHESTTSLPEMFFDDPIADAKIRHVEYKSIQNDEWERFQREIKEESIMSTKLVYGEQANLAADREITEISEQMHRWSKVIDLEHKLQDIVKVEKPCHEFNVTDENLSDDEVFDYVDWRSKKLT